MSRRRCCCGCRVFYDRFDRGGPTQVIGDPWDDVNATGEWWIDGSTQAKYPADSALYEVTGSGEIIGFQEKARWSGRGGELSAIRQAM